MRKRAMTKRQAFKAMRSSEPSNVVADRMGLEPSTIRKVRNGELYPDWYAEYHGKEYKPKSRAEKVSYADYCKIRLDQRSGAAIADQMGRSQKVVDNIRNGTGHKHFAKQFQKDLSAGLFDGLIGDTGPHWTITQPWRLTA